MKEEDFTQASEEERERCIIRPYDGLPLTVLVPGSNSHLLFGENATVSFITMKAGSVFELHSHPEEQIMFVLEGYCDEIVSDKIYHLVEGDALHLPGNIIHGAFIHEVDCKAIDFFVPARKDYARKYHDQNPGAELWFVE